jgi:hypothetical protein
LRIGCREGEKQRNAYKNKKAHTDLILIECPKVSLSLQKTQGAR